jgi:hypothetical protein
LLDVNGTPIERTWQIVHLRSKQLSPTSVVFRQFLLDHAATHLEHEYAPFERLVGVTGAAAGAGPVK